MTDACALSGLDTRGREHVLVALRGWSCAWPPEERERPAPMTDYFADGDRLRLDVDAVEERLEEEARVDYANVPRALRRRG